MELPHKAGPWHGHGPNYSGLMVTRRRYRPVLHGKIANMETDIEAVTILSDGEMIVKPFSRGRTVRRRILPREGTAEKRLEKGDP